MQKYTEIPSSKTLADSLQLILQNDKTGISCSEGTAFPTVDVQVGQLCYRSDQKKLYQLIDAEEPTWRCIADASGDARHLDGGAGNAINYEKRNLNDWNSMPTGFYEGSNMLNSPSGDTYWRVIQIRQGNSDGYATQIAFGATTGKVFTRFEKGGQWSSWQELFAGTSGQKVTGLNADKLQDRVPGNASGNLALNNGTKNVNLNADMVDGYHVGSGSGQIPLNNGTKNNGLNADQLDGYHAGNAKNQIPVSNGKLSVGLNAEMIGGMKATDFLTVSSEGEIGKELSTLTVGNLAATTIKATRIEAPTIVNSSSYTGSNLTERTVIGSGANGYDSTSNDNKYADYSRYDYSFQTKRAISAGTYDLKALLQKLVNYAHIHKVDRKTVHYDCRSDCNCGDDGGY